MNLTEQHATWAGIQACAGRCRLVQWCHGAPGFTPVLAEAHRALQHEVPQADLVAAAETAGQVIWERGLLKKVITSMCRRCLMWIPSAVAGL